MNGADYYTALEIAELAQRLKVSQMPQTKRRVQEFIKREGWETSALCRDRIGRGGGREYHFSLFPEFLIDAMIAADQKAQAEEDAKRAMAVQQTALIELGETKLTARQRTVMEARAAIVQSVKSREIEAGETTAQAAKFIVVKAASDGRFGRLANQANDRGGNKRTLSYPSVRRWIKDHRDGGVIALAPKATKDTHSFPLWFPQFISYYARPQKPTIAAALDDLRYKARINDVPSYDQVRRCLKKLDKVHGTQARHRGREGALELKARHAYVVRDRSGLLPTSVYTADGKTFDAEIQHPIHGRPFRPEVTSILDVATDRCVGWWAGLSENARDVMFALCSASVNCGVPAVFYVDNGSGFNNEIIDNDLTGLCGILGITKMNSLPYSSQSRGIIERYNGSVFTPFAKELPTYVGKDMDREARQKAFKQTRKELRETGASATLPTWTEFLRMMGERVDAYNNNINRGLEHRDQNGRKVKRTPLEAWAASVANGFEPVAIAPQEVDGLFRPVERRRTRRGMVSWITNDYFHLSLEPYDGLDILVGYDIHDASKVWCYEIDKLDGEEARGPLICVAVFEGNKERYIPWSMEQDAIEKRRKSRLRRLDAHRDEVEAEANPNRFLTQSAQPTVSIGMGHPSQPVTIDAVVSEVSDPPPQIAAATATQTPQKRSGGRPVFSDDQTFAAWCCENPEKITEKDLTLLRSLLRDKSARECLRIHGVDLMAVENLIRSAA